MRTARRALSALLAIAACTGSGTAGAQASAAADQPGPNAALVRVTRGEYSYRTLKDGRIRGSERFELLAHPDDTRTLVMWNDLYARNGQIHAVLRVDGRFRPLETQYTYWSEGKFKGSAYFRLAGTTLHGVVRTSAGGLATQRVEVPDAVSFATHPLAGDGWHAWYVDPSRPDVQPATLVNFDASADVSTPAGARIQPQQWRYEGRARVTVPAGTFDCERYSGAGATVWTTGQDRVLVRFEWTSLDREYVLTRHETSEQQERRP